MTRTSALAALLLTFAFGLTAGAHVTPVVIMRKQAEVIRQTLPEAVSFFVTNVRIGKPELRAIVDRAHYTPTSQSVKFYSGKDSSGQLVGTVVFPYVDTQHGPIEVGVTIGRDGAIQRVLVTRASVEMKPWILDVERSGALDKLQGARVGDVPQRLSQAAGLHGMVGYMADAIATAAYRGLVLEDVLRPPAVDHK